jgi:ABC-type dipeptide/oligopeptide/nickel transport system ATPase component
MRDGLSRALESPEEGSGTVIVVSHDILRVFSTVDRVAIMRQGEIVHDGPTDELSVRDLVGQEGDRAAG